MAGIESRLLTVRRAIVAFRDTPGRSGRFVQLDADELLVAGDMHGNVENFRGLMARADLAAHPRRHLVVQELIHGPFRYPTGGDKSHQLVDLVCALKAQFPRQVHYLLGNHEMAQLTGRQVSKNDEELNDLFVRGVRECYGERGDELYSLYLVLFRVIPAALRTAGRVLVSHSLPTAGAQAAFDPAALLRDPSQEEDMAPGGSLYSLVWGRDTRQETLEGFLRRMEVDRLVSGHIPCDDGFERPTPAHLILDTQGQFAAYALLPADRPPTAEEWDAAVRMLP